jgi:hypothetical protein
MSDLKWLSIIAGGIVGTALMVALSFGFMAAIPIVTDEILLLILLVIIVLGYLTTGFITGALANWKGMLHGSVAASLAYFVAFIFNMVSEMIYAPSYMLRNVELIPFFYIGYFIVAGLGALGGFLGERTRR